MTKQEELKLVKERLWKLTNKIEGQELSTSDFAEEIGQLVDRESILGFELGKRKIACNDCMNELSYLKEGKFRCPNCRKEYKYEKGLKPLKYLKPS